MQTQPRRLPAGTTDLAQPAWTPVSTNTLAGGTAYFSDPQGQSYSSRLYRLRMP